MHRFALPLVKGDDPLTGMPAFGFEINGMFIYDPTVSDCGRFQVDPTEAYGLSAQDAKQLSMLNKLVADAADAAINAGCLHIQQQLGIATGDVAGQHFSGASSVAPIAQELMDYIEAEYAALT